MKRPKIWQAPAPQHFAPADLAALLPTDGTGSTDKRESWLSNITDDVLYLLRHGRKRPAPPPPSSDDGQDARLLRDGIRVAPVSDYGPRGNQHTGANQFTRPRK